MLNSDKKNDANDDLLHLQVAHGEKKICVGPLNIYLQTLSDGQNYAPRFILKRNNICDDEN